MQVARCFEQSRLSESTLGNLLKMNGNGTSSSPKLIDFVFKRRDNVHSGLQIQANFQARTDKMKFYVSIKRDAF